jgi:putative flippase GtrA
MGVGALATLIDLATLTALVSGLHLSPRVASLPGLTLGIAVQFFGNKLFAFGDRSEKWGRQLAQFLAVEALGFVANLALYDFAVSRFALHYIVLRLITTNVVYFGLCLPLWSRIFRASSEGASP